MICKNCGSELNDGTMFCCNCGIKCEETENTIISENVSEGQFCRECGAGLKDGALFCNQCGASVNEDETVTEPVCAIQKFDERKYKFKNVPRRTFNVWDLLIGGKAYFCVTDDNLFIREETHENMLDRVTIIPYNEIVSFKVKYRASKWLMIIAVLISCCIPFWDDDSKAVVCGIFIVFACLLNLLHSVLIVDVADGRRIKIKLKRIGRKLKKEKENFVADLSQMLKNTYVLQNVNKSQSGIKVITTKADWEASVNYWIR